MKIKILILLIFISSIIIFEFLSSDSKEITSIVIPKIPIKALVNTQSPDELPVYNDFEGNNDDIKDLFEDFNEKDFRQNNPSAWSLRVASYDNKNDVMDDFVLLQQEGFKPYIRDEEEEGNKIYILYVGPRLNKNNILSIKSRIQDLINKTPRVVNYNE
tara:strand:+ start:513 stop:989 length:477 start_codon:yes stop_codon:yes gene_type:complete